MWHEVILSLTLDLSLAMVEFFSNKLESSLLHLLFRMPFIVLSHNIAIANEQRAPSMIPRPRNIIGQQSTTILSLLVFT